MNYQIIEEENSLFGNLLKDEIHKFDVRGEIDLIQGLPVNKPSKGVSVVIASKLHHKLSSCIPKSNTSFCLFISQSKPSRSQIRRLMKFTRVYTTLPFIHDFIKSRGVHAEYVGNPYVDLVRKHSFTEILYKESQKPSIAIILGRKQKVNQSFLKLLPELSIYYHFIVLKSKSLNVKIHDGLNTSFFDGDKFDLLKHCNAAIVLLLEDSLQAGLVNNPHILMRRRNFLGRRSNWISPMNVIAEREIVKELPARTEPIKKELDRILYDHQYCAGILDDYQKVREIIGMEPSLRKVAILIVESLEKQF